MFISISDCTFIFFSCLKLFNSKNHRCTLRDIFVYVTWRRIKKFQNFMTFSKDSILSGKVVQDLLFTRKNIDLFTIIYTLEKFTAQHETSKKVQFCKYVTWRSVFSHRFFSIWPIFENLGIFSTWEDLLKNYCHIGIIVLIYKT